MSNSSDNSHIEWINFKNNFLKDILKNSMVNYKIKPDYKIIVNNKIDANKKNTKTTSSVYNNPNDEIYISER